MKRNKKKKRNSLLFLKTIDANSKVKEMLKKKEISEDDEKQANEYMQKITDSYIGNADSILKDKETDLMQV